ncbi:MAG: class I SAM-dependent methyltransferase [Rhodocyclaceae bacterium]|nr:class I SAM-dependent methyltransferase [Rhodocyclaceae bacterium]
MSAKTHWEQVYGSKPAQSVSWYQPHAANSIALIKAAAADLDSRIIDIGGGASTLVDDLLDLGYTNLSVLDLSAEALAVARRRLGERAGSIHWIEGDITTIALPRHGFDVWHDRAVFHFLTEPEQRAAYLERVRHAVRPGGHVIVATFALDGPAQCSGLPVARYTPEGLHDEFGAAFELIEHREEYHQTPAGNTQHFIYCFCLKAG